jgi:hypothetical protein
MSDRGFLFLFSILMVVGGLAAAVWLFMSGQAATVDGLFMVLTALLIAVVFTLYIMFVIRRAMQAAAQPAKQPVKAGAPSPATKSAPAAVQQS